MFTIVFINITTMVKFDGSTIVERNETELISTRLGDDMVLMNTNSGDYVGMNAVGTDMWQLLAAPLSIDEILSRIVNMYDVDEQYGKEKLNAFIQLMLERKVLVIKEEVTA